MTRPTLILGVEPRVVVPVARSLNNNNIGITRSAYLHHRRKGFELALKDAFQMPLHH
jgi:hypothetical protein